MLLLVLEEEEEDEEEDGEDEEEELDRVLRCCPSVVRTSETICWKHPVIGSVRATMA